MRKRSRLLLASTLGGLLCWTLPLQAQPTEEVSGEATEEAATVIVEDLAAKEAPEPAPAAAEVPTAEAVGAEATAATEVPAQVANPGAEPDVIVITGTPPVPLPKRGMDKSAVAREFGQPGIKHPTVGGSSRQQPPISRWDYADYSVFFEYNHVIDVVRRDYPAPVQVRDGLQQGAPQ